MTNKIMPYVITFVTVIASLWLINADPLGLGLKEKLGI